MDASNPPKDPLPTTNPTKSKAKKKTVSQASTAEEPAEELPLPPSPLTINILSSDKPDPFADFTSPRLKSHCVQYIVTIIYNSKKLRGFTRIYDINRPLERLTWTGLEHEVELQVEEYKKSHPERKPYYQGK